MKKILFVADKSGKIDFTVKDLATKNDVAIIAPSIMSYAFKYPRYVSYQDLPITSLTPIYKNQFREYGKPNLIYSNGEYTELDIFKKLAYISKSIVSEENLYNENDLTIARSNVMSYIKSFDEIHCVTDTNLSGIRGFMFYFEKYLGIENLKEENNFPEITFLQFSSLYNEDVIRDFNNRKKIFESDFFLGQIESYKKKDYFNFNFNTNSLVMISHALRKLNIQPEKVFTKNMLQTLMLIHNESKKQNKKEICLSLLFKVRLDKHMGDNHTTHAIEEYLKELGLISLINRQCVSITDNGIAFLSLLHPKMKDPKLSYNVGEDFYNNDLSLEEFKTKYNKKIESMFKKQKRFSSTRIQKD